MTFNRTVARKTKCMIERGRIGTDQQPMQDNLQKYSSVHFKLMHRSVRV